MFDRFLITLLQKPKILVGKVNLNYYFKIICDFVLLHIFKDNISFLRKLIILVNYLLFNSMKSSEALYK